MGSQIPRVIVIVNQSGDDTPIDIASVGDGIAVISDTGRGLSRGRNIGLNYLLGIVPAAEMDEWLVGFPDDDVWFDAQTLPRAAAVAEEQGASFVAGRLLSADGQDSRASWPKRPSQLTNSNFLGRTVEASTFIRLSAFTAPGIRFNESMGAGSSLGLASGEGVELLLRLTDGKKSFGFYDPEIHVYENSCNYGREKEALYATGEGAALQWGLKSRYRRIWRLYIRPSLRPLRKLAYRQSPNTRVAWRRARMIRAGSKTARRIASISCERDAR